MYSSDDSSNVTLAANRHDFINQEACCGDYFFRIIDNMPVTWCYDVEDGQKYCNPGFPIGCLVTLDGRAKDACVINVSCDFCLWTCTLLNVLKWGFY